MFGGIGAKPAAGAADDADADGDVRVTTPSAARSRLGAFPAAASSYRYAVEEASAAGVAVVVGMVVK